MPRVEVWRIGATVPTRIILGCGTHEDTVDIVASRSETGFDLAGIRSDHHQQHIELLYAGVRPVYRQTCCVAASRFVERQRFAGSRQEKP